MATLGGTSNPSYGSGHWTAPTAVAGALTLPSGGPWKITGLGMWMAGDSSLGATSSQPDVRLALWNSSGTLLAYSSEFNPAANSYPNSDKQEKAISYGPINGSTSVRVGYMFDSGDAGGCQCSLESGGTRYYDTTSTSSSSCSFSTATGEPGVWLTYEAWNVAPSAPTLNSPANNAYSNDLTPTFNITPIDTNGDAATQVNIQVSADPTFATTIWDNTVAGSWTNNASADVMTYSGPALSYYGTYYWRARTYDTASALWGPYSAYRVYYPWNNAPNAPTLNSPANGVAVVAPALTPTFAFTPSDPEGDPATFYYIQVSTDPTFATVTHWDPGWVSAGGPFTNGVQKNVPYAGLAMDYMNHYYWRVKTYDSVAGGEGPWSGAFDYYPYNRAPSAPTLNSPANGAVLTDTTPDLNFTPSDADGDACTKYRYQVATDNLFTYPGSLYEDTTITATSGNNVAINKTVQNTLVRGTTYYWRAMTFDSVSGDWGPWSGARSFSINAVPTATLVWPNADGNNFAKVTYTPGCGWNTPRMIVEWTYNDAQAQVAYQVVVTQCATAGGTYTPFYDSTSVASSATRSITIPQDLTEGYYYKVYVNVSDGYETGTSATRTTRARWGKAVRTHDVRVGGAVPTALVQTEAIYSNGPNPIAMHEWNSSTTAGGALNHATWKASIAEVTKDNYLYYRVWLIAYGATPVVSPTFNSIGVTASGYVAQPDVWLPEDIGTVGGAIEIGDRFVGSQCLRINGNGTTRTVYQDIPIDTGVQHILQARIHSTGNSGAKVWLSTTGGTPLTALDGTTPVTVGAVTEDTGWTQYVSEVFTSGVSTVRVNCTVTGAAATAGYFDAIKLERGPVASSWVPGLVGNAVTIDSGGIQVDANADGIFRLRAGRGTARDRIDLADSKVTGKGLLFGGDAQLYSDVAGQLNVPSINGPAAYGIRASAGMTGGGTITIDASGYIKWSTRIIALGLGRGADKATVGYFDINNPTSGTVTGVGAAPSRTATAAGIQLNGWEALYYILPLGSAQTSVPANFRVASYTADVDIPSHWVLIAVKNGDDNYYYFPWRGHQMGAGQSRTPNGEVPSGAIVMWTGTDSAIPAGWYLCDGANGTPDLRERMIIARATGAANSAGGTVSATAALTHSGTAVSAHSGAAVGDHSVTQPSAHSALGTHTHMNHLIHNGAQTLSTTSRFGSGTAATRNYTGSFTSASGSYNRDEVESVSAGTPSAHTGTAVSAHSVTQPSAHSVTDPAAHAIMYYYKLAFIMKA